MATCKECRHCETLLDKICEQQEYDIINVIRNEDIINTCNKRVFWQAVHKPSNSVLHIPCERTTYKFNNRTWTNMEMFDISKLTLVMDNNIRNKWQRCDRHLVWFMILFTTAYLRMYLSWADFTISRTLRRLKPPDHHVMQ